MARINSRSKGRRGEAKACDFFHEWSGMKFVRVPASGGLRWKNTTNTTGDIIADEPNYVFPFSVEVKNMAEINFQHLIYDVKSDIKKFWSQALSDAKRGKKVPILLMRQNGKRGGFPGDMFFVVLPKKFVDGLEYDIKPRIEYNRSFVIFNTRILKLIPYKEVQNLAYKFLKIR